MRIVLFIGLVVAPSRVRELKLPDNLLFLDQRVAPSRVRELKPFAISP